MSRRLAIGAAAVLLVVAAGYFPLRRLIAPYAATALGLGETPAATVAELTLAETIPLGEVKGRLDHMALDQRRGRLFLADLQGRSGHRRWDYRRYVRRRSDAYT
jgi:hypothetical protein